MYFAQFILLGIFTFYLCPDKWNFLKPCKFLQFQKSEEHRTENTTPTSFKEPNSTKMEMETSPSEEECKTTNTPFSWLLLFLKILLWMSLWRIFIELQFGAVFFAVSALIFIYFNTRTGKSKSKTLSAYSVFNPNCERLQGTITAEQFERELLHRPTQDTVSWCHNEPWRWNIGTFHAKEKHMIRNWYYGLKIWIFSWIN